MTRRKTTDGVGSMPPLMLQILLAVADRPTHGYAMLQEIEQRMDASYEIGAGTLYRTLRRLTEAGWIEEADDDEHRQRRVYTITALGHEHMTREVDRLQRLVAWADAVGVRLGDVTPRPA